MTVVAIGVLSLTPPRLRPMTGAPHVDEHLIIFIIAAFLICVGCRSWRRVLAIGALLIGYSAALELAQLLVPGRHARLSDFITNIAGTALGAAIAYAVARLRALRRPLHDGPPA